MACTRIIPSSEMLTSVHVSEVHSSIRAGNKLWRYVLFVGLFSHNVMKTKYTLAGKQNTHGPIIFRAEFSSLH
jgi:hypothetical protein